ncbi:heavy metal translocating P-type ATPase [Blastomonas fulva]|uniref:Nitrogen fixation protein FixI n=1 Tax=Blastomonas fulva TaxID=1550728 RepID=A0ABM6M3N0_9SPHN|nr:heavy metal translocating P-type ATPase [Blastomonas fulva]ASR50521.1 nitrogen fixation protein FixI [Blastomonas fulva]MDM7927504.1 heavy metal translocating P-type ATPase [Blastomonas fulva]MDM7964944.1 heavy metal translocating P-type ATPase [Blastomonas fulva]
MNAFASLTPRPAPRPANPPALIERDFAVPDIRCAGCISKLEQGLVRDSRIHSARVNFTEKRVHVSCTADAQMPDLLGAFTSLGFEAHPIGDGPKDIDPDAANSRELLRAVAVSGFAMMNIMLLSVSVWSGAAGVTRDLFHWLSAMIALPTIAYAGRPFFRSAWRALAHGHTNMDVPISIGVTLATALSLYETATHGPHAYFDSAVMLLFFLLCGRWLDSVMRDRARGGVTALLRNMGTGAMVFDSDGSTRWVDATELNPGMVMLVAAGERLAADGVIVAGASRIDLSLLTGESAPQEAGTDDVVHAGTLNLETPIRVRVTAAGTDTAIADIARLMGEASQGKSRYVRIADRAARLYAPAVHTLALMAFGGWMLAGAGLHDALLISVAVLIITCPCALGLAVPAAQIVAAGALMKVGVLIKDGSALERLAEVDRALIDKTGTLTLGRPVASNLYEIAPEHHALLLALARASRHPLSAALTRDLGAQGIAAAEVTHVQETPGFGVEAQWQGHIVTLGRPQQGDAGTELATELAIDMQPVALVRFADALRPDAIDAIAALKAQGIDAMILSGDRAAAVAPVARTLGLTAITGMNPQDKLAAIARHTGAGLKVLMIGDGLNDGPALAAGHASMAPGSASDVGKNASDCIFLGDRLMPVADTIRMARRTQAIVRQNFMLAIGYNVIAVPLAFAGLVTPLVAALAMSGSSLIVVSNALRLKRTLK